MADIQGKLFRSIQSGNIISLQYDTQKTEYYAFIKEATSAGLKQVIITSDIMISLLDYFIHMHKGIISGIEFFEEDSELSDDISSYLKSMKEDRAFWSILKEKLVFLSKEDSIDIKKIELSFLLSGTFVWTSIYVNGIFSTSDKNYSEIKRVLIDRLGELLH